MSQQDLFGSDQQELDLEERRARTVVHPNPMRVRAHLLEVLSEIRGASPTGASAVNLRAAGRCGSPAYSAKTRSAGRTAAGRAKTGTEAGTAAVSGAASVRRNTSIC